jgi:hypothetical protein
MAAKPRPVREPDDFHKEGKKQSPPIWYLSEPALETSIIGATITFSFIFIIVWLLKASFLVDQSDIQTTVQISAGLGALSLAVPLFLRDFEVQKTLWKSFLILSSIFLISTCIGFVAYLLQSASEEVKLTFIGIISVVVVSNFRTAMALQRLRSTTDHTFVHISPTTPWEFLFVILLSFACIISSSGLTASFLLLFSYGMMMLFATLAASIISVLSHHDNHDRMLKNAIQEVLEKNLGKAFAMSDLLSALREGPYNGQSELVSRTILEDAVREMDRESRGGEPKATFVNGKIIPRWNDDYKQQSFKDMPFILVLESRNNHGGIEDILSDLRNNYSEELLNFVSQKSGLSIELLEDGNVLDLLLEFFDDFLFLEFFDGFWKYGSATMVYIKDRVDRVRNEKESEFSPSFDEVLKSLPRPTPLKGKFGPSFDRVAEPFHKFTWFCSELKDMQEDIILRLIEHLFSDQVNSFIELFNKETKDEEFLEMFYHHLSGMRWWEIREHFEELLRENLPGLRSIPEPSFLEKLAESAISSFLREKLKELCRIGKLEHIVPKGRVAAVLDRMGKPSADFWKLSVDEKN